MNRKQKQLLLIAALCAVLFLAVYLLFGREDTGNGRSTLTGNASESQASANLFDRMLATNTADTSKTRLAPLAPKNAAVAEARTDRSTIDCPVIVKGMDGAMNAKRFQEKLRSKFEETDARLAALLQQVMQSSNPIEKAGASYLSLQMAYENSKNNFLKMHPGCEGNPVCEKELDASPTVPQQAIDEVAKLALNSRDLALYAMVFNMCNRYSWDEGYCSQINALQWANRDPENGAVWLHTLTHLQPESEGKDKDFIDNALFRLSTAKTFDAGFFSLAKLQGSQILSTSDPAIQARLQELSSHIWDNTPLPAYSRVVKACSGEMLNNGNRRHTCERITQQFRAKEISSSIMQLHSRWVAIWDGLQNDSKRCRKILKR